VIAVVAGKDNSVMVAVALSGRRASRVQSSQISMLMQRSKP
jgi:hypothetical protein